MGFGSLRDLARDLNFWAHGVDATVTLEDAIVETRAIWLTNDFLEQPEGGTFTKQASRRVLCLRRDQVAAVPIGTRVDAPERDGEDLRGWTVDGYVGLRDDHHRVTVLPIDEDDEV